MPPSVKESSSAATSSVTAETEDVYDQYQESKVVDTSRRVLEKETSSFNFSTDDEKQPSSFSSNFSFNGREESGVAAGGLEKERLDVKNSFKGSTSQKTSSVGYAQSSTDIEEKVQKVSPPRQKAYRDERLEKQGHGPRKDSDNLDMSTSSYKQQNLNNSNANTTGAKQNEPEPPPDGRINEILEVGFKLSSIVNVVCCIKSL